MNCVVYMDLRPFQCAQFLVGLKLLKLGNFLLKMMPILEGLKPVTKANIAAVKIVVEEDAQLSVKDITSCTGISEGSVQTILKKRLDLRKVCARWVPHLLSEEQKTQRLKVPCPSGHTVTGRFYKNSVLKKVKEFYNKKRPSKGWSGVHLLHDNASCHKYEVKSFLASEKVKVLNHPPYSPDLSPCDFFLFPRLKKMLSGNKYTSRSSLLSAIYQCLQQIPKGDYLSAFHEWVKRLQKCVSVKGEYFEGL